MRLAVAAVVLAAASACGDGDGGGGGDGGASAERQEDVARRGADDMPGLAELRAGAADIAVAYRPIAAGGRITCTTADPGLVTALHRWAEAQTMDHGTHAEPA